MKRKWIKVSKNTYRRKYELEIDDWIGLVAVALAVNYVLLRLILG